MEGEGLLLVCYTFTRQRMAMNLAILSRTRTACERFFARAKIWSEDVRSRYALPILGVFVAIATVAVYMAPVQAQQLLGPATDDSNWSFFGPIILLITSLLYNIVQLLLTFDSTLTTMMIQFAQYNNFVLANPVTTGWPLVRDVCNMFFILVLLIVAFATIIGYEPFDYKKTVPKLLLMSVLINFSKTLVGLMIDFSQVVMLTFVNGFRAAAFGNVMNAFGMTDFLSVIKNTNAQPTVVDNSALMISLLFAVGMLSVLAMMLLIMSIYFLVRIILLWILLILSPLAFFAWALPDKIQKALDPLTGKWWKQLAALLSGGPIVAFFMWLTFAMVQNSGTAGVAAREQIYVAGASDSNIGVTSSPMGAPDRMTTFMVATIMLLLGLKTAVDVSGEAAPELGKLAKKIQSTGGPVGWAAKLGYRAGRGTARAGARVGMAGARAADRKWQLTQQAGKKISGLGETLGSSRLASVPVIGLGIGMAAKRVATGGDALKGVGAKDTAELRKGIQSQLEGKSEADRKSRLVMLSQSGNASEMRIASQMLLERAMGDGKDNRMKELEAEFKAKYITAGLSEADATTRGKADAVRAYTSEAAESAAQLLNIYKEKGDTEAENKLNEKIEKSGGLLEKSFEALAGRVKSMDLSTINKNMTADSAFNTALFSRLGLVDKGTGKIAAGWDNADGLKKLKENGGPAWDNLQAYVHEAQFSPNGEKMVMDQLAAMAPGAGVDNPTWAAAEKARFAVTAKGDNFTYGIAAGNPYAADMITGATKASVEGGYVDMTKLEDVTQRLPATGTMSQAAVLSELQNAANPIRFQPSNFSIPFDVASAQTFTDAVSTARTSASGGTAPSTLALGRAQAAGFSSEVAAMYEKGGSKTYATPGARTAHASIMSGAMSGLAAPVVDPATGATSMKATRGAIGLQARNLVAGIDLDAFKEDGEYTKTVVDALHGNEDKFVAAYIAADAKGKAKMKKMVKTLSTIDSKKAPTAKDPTQADVLSALRASSEKEFREEMGFKGGRT